MKNQIKKELQLVYLFTYQFKKPIMPEGLDENGQKEWTEKYGHPDMNKERFTSISCAKFAQIDAKPEYLLKESISLQKKLESGKTIDNNNQLVKFFNHLLSISKGLEERENFKLKKCFVIDVNDWK